MSQHIFESKEGNERLRTKRDSLRQKRDYNHELFLHLHASLLNTISNYLAYNIDSCKSEEEETDDARQKNIVWNIDEIIEMTDRGLSRVIGYEYEGIDRREVHTRLPLPPFLFVTRVTSINAIKGQLKYSSIVCEYDVPANSPYFQNNVSPLLVLQEISQCGILLLNYISVDEEFDRDVTFRAVTSNTTYHSSSRFRPGVTIEAEYEISSFSRLGNKLLFQFSLEIYIEGLHILTRNGVGGVFAVDELGHLIPPLPDVVSGNILNQPSHCFTPESHCARTSFSKVEVLALQNGRGDICFGPGFQKGIGLQLYSPPFKMLDRVTKIELRGGGASLGLVESEAEITQDHWAFDVHFKNDAVFPGNILLAGSRQLALFYLTYLGLRNILEDKLHEEECIPNIETKIRFLNQVSRRNVTIRYVMEVVNLKVHPVEVIWNCTALMDGHPVFISENNTLRML